jgi:hypothetical protein
LDRERVGEAELGANALDLRGPGIFRDIQQGRVAGESQQEEDRGIHAKDHDQ